MPTERSGRKPQRRQRRAAVHTCTFQLRIDPELLEEAERRAESHKPERISLSKWIREAMLAKIDAEDGKLKPSPAVQELDARVKEKLGEVRELLEQIDEKTEEGLSPIKR